MMEKIEVKASLPPRVRDREFGKKLDAVLNGLSPADGWQQIAVFENQPKKAHAVRSSLRRRFASSEYCFAANVTNGVGRLFARRLPVEG